MKRFLKKISYLVVLIVALLSYGEVKAASATISVKANVKSIVVGRTFNVTVTVSSTDTLGTWKYSLNYNSSIFSLTSSTPAPYVVDYGDNSIKSKTYTYTFKAIKSGTGAFSVTSAEVLDYKTEASILNNKTSAEVKVITQAELEASYSKNNYLSSLGVEGVEGTEEIVLNPEFDKNTLEYSVDVQPGTEKVTIVGKKEDSKASVSGLGEVSLVDGNNRFEIVVTAENGNQRVYVLNINVLELDPINVTVNGEDYTVVRKKDALIIPSTFTETTVFINGEEVPALKSEITNFTLVGLNDNSGNIKLFIYNENENSFTEYKEVTLGSLVIYPLDNNEELKGYERLQITINGIEVDAYHDPDVKDYYLIKGLNVETGKENYYQYDKIENTFQRFSFENSNGDEEFYLIMLTCAGGVILLCLIVILSLITKKGKTVKKLKVKKEENNNKDIDEKNEDKDKEKIEDKDPEDLKPEDNVEEEKLSKKELKKMKKLEKKNKKKDKEKTIFDDDF